MMTCCALSEYGLFLSSAIFAFFIADPLRSLCARPFGGLCLGVAGLGGPRRRPRRGCFAAQHAAGHGSGPSAHAGRRHHGACRGDRVAALVVLSLLRLRSLPFREFHGMNLGPAAPGSRVAARTMEVAGSVRGRLRAGDSGASSSVRLLAASGVPGAGLRPQGSPVARWQKALRASGAVPC